MIVSGAPPYVAGEPEDGVGAATSPAVATMDSDACGHTSSLLRGSLGRV